MPDQILPEIQGELDAESLRWLRRRFIGYIGFSSCVAAFLTIGLIVGFVADMISKTRVFLPGSLLTGLCQRVSGKPAARWTRPPVDSLV